MISHLCEEVISPGTVVFLIGGGSFQDSTWGVTVPYAYFDRMSSRDAVATFNKYSGDSCTQIPVLKFDGNMEWKLCFKQAFSTMKPLCSLDVFIEDLRNDNLNSVHGALWACSHRDGSRYYGELLRWLEIFAKTASRTYSAEDLRGNPAIRRLYDPGCSIREWKEAQKVAALT